MAADRQTQFEESSAAAEGFTTPAEGPQPCSWAAYADACHCEFCRARDQWRIAVYEASRA